MRIMLRVVVALQPKLVYGKGRFIVQKTLLGDSLVKIPVKSFLKEGSQVYHRVRASLKKLMKSLVELVKCLARVKLM